jgi:hypothetical protein
MDEARQVLTRLERIERLRDGGGSRLALLAEVRGLLADGERWLAAEPEGTERARALLEESRRRLEPGEEARASAA